MIGVWRLVYYCLLSPSLIVMTSSSLIVMTSSSLILMTLMNQCMMIGAVVVLNTTEKSPARTYVGNLVSSAGLPLIYTPTQLPRLRFTILGDQVLNYFSLQNQTGILQASFKMFDLF